MPGFSLWASTLYLFVASVVSCNNVTRDIHPKYGLHHAHQKEGGVAPDWQPSEINTNSGKTS